MIEIWMRIHAVSDNTYNIVYPIMPKYFYNE
jgi:hypothetical protein